MAGTCTHTASSLPEPLTDRELEILTCLGEGLSNQEIAKRLYLAVTTVRWYNSQIYGKLGVNNREAALALAESLGLLQPGSDTTADREVQTNLPLQTTPFIGRQRELADLARLIAEPETRLISILAPGGMGKTRLSLAAAGQQIRHFSDGVFFVPLAPLSSPNDIVTAIAEHVGFSFDGSDSPQQQLLDYFRERSALLVLDNFEHLLDGAPLVTDIIQAAPQVKVLATSREKLNLSGETVFTLSGLQFPDWETPEDALEFDAVKLFMQSAHRARPDFELKAVDLNYLARICRLTEGMPLGIVLAAGWVDLLSLGQIATEIQRGLDILETEMRDVPPRQRSIRATFNTSWNRLSNGEQDIFTKLSVFSGGFTTESAQAVAGANLLQLRKLADKALLYTAISGRYEVHELLRQYAEEKLLQAGKAETVQQAHGEYFMDFLAHRRADFMSRQTETALTIKTEFDNIRRAWLWAAQHQKYEAIHRAADCLVEATEAGSLIWRTEALFQQAADALGPEPDAAPHPVWDYIALVDERLRMQLSKERVERPYVETILARARQRGDQRQIGMGLYLLVQCCQRAGEFDTGLDYCQQALQVWRELDEPIEVSNVLMFMNISLLHLGWPEKAQASLEECAGIRRRLNQWVSLAGPLMALARSQIHYGQLPQAQVYLDEAIALGNAYGIPPNWDRILFLQALLRVFRGDLTDADTFLTAMQHRARETRKTTDRANALKTAGILASLRDDRATLHELSSSSEGPLTALHIMNFHAWAEALAHCTLGEDSATKHVLYISFVEALKINSLTLQQISLPIAAVLAARDGDLERAVELLGLAHTAQADLTGWIAQWRLLDDVRADLEAELGVEAYAAAWERGAQLDLKAIVAQLREQYSGQTL